MTGVALIVVQGSRKTSVPAIEPPASGLNIEVRLKKRVCGLGRRLGPNEMKTLLATPDPIPAARIGRPVDVLLLHEADRLVPPLGDDRLGTKLNRVP